MVVAEGILESRIAAAQQLMRDQEIDFLAVAPSSDLVYFLDVPAHASERLALLLIPQTGRPDMIVPTLETSRFADNAGLINIRTWEETDNPIDLVTEFTSGIAAPKISVSDQIWGVFLVRLANAIPSAELQEGGDLIKHLRMTKDEAELENLRLASSAADRAWNEFIETAQIAGKSEREAATILSGLRRKHGLDVPTIGICASGPNSAAPHHITGDRIIQKGDTVIFDFGGSYNHYRADVTRTVHIGEPDDEYRRVYQIVLDANQAAYEVIRPGIPCQEVDRVARKVITDAGYGEYFIHRVGHGIGIDGHEEPYLVEGNTLSLEAGMVFSDEPGIYIPGEFGVRIEDSVVVTEDGGEKINHCRRELTIMS